MKGMGMLCLPMVFCAGIAFAQNDGGMVCGPPNTKPELVLRIQVLDKTTHFPIDDALINIKDASNGWASGAWRVNQDGVAVYVAAVAGAIPGTGQIEITSPNYKYVTIAIQQLDLLQREDDNRLFLPAFPIQWADLSQIPSSQQLIDLLASGQFQIGVRSVRGPGGVLYPNLAPACYQYVVEMERAY